MLKYDLTKITKIPLEDKILLPLKFDEGSRSIADKPFCFFFDDTRNLYFSYFLDFTDSTSYRMGVHLDSEGKEHLAGLIPSTVNEILKFPKLVNQIINESKNLETTFYNIVCPHQNKIFPFHLLKNSSLILELIKGQVAKWETTTSGHKIYNPTVIVPFIPLAELEAIVKFCRENLVNLVVFDFINFEIKREVVVKTFKKETEKFSLTVVYKKYWDLDSLWNKYFSQGAFYSENYQALIIKDSSLALKNVDKISIPADLRNKVKIKDWVNLPTEDRINLACIYYYSVKDTFFNNLDLKNCCAFSPEEFIKVVSYIYSQSGKKPLDFHLSNWNEWVGKTQSWSLSDQKKVLNFLVKESIVGSFEFYSLESMYGSQVSNLKELNELSKDYFNNYVSLWRKVKNFLSTTPSAFTPFLAKTSVEDLVAFNKLIPHSYFNAPDFVYNPNLVSILKEFGPHRFSGINKILHLLSFQTLKEVLNLDHNGMKLMTYFNAELPKILDRKSTICKSTFDLVLNNTQGSLEADVFIYKLMLSHDYAQLALALNEPRLKVKPDTKKLMHLNLLKLRQHPEVAKVLEVLA